MAENSRILVAGGGGMVGSAVLRNLKDKKYSQILSPSHDELDLLDRDAVFSYFEPNKPEYVIMAAAKVGGIGANAADPVTFFSDNIRMSVNVIDAAHEFNVSKLIFLGSSCIYPKMSPQPIKEEYLLSGPLEPTNEGYALAKIGAVKLTQYYRQQFKRDFISLMPTNLYGPGDNYHPSHSHVLPALLRRFHEAKQNKQDQVVIWGSGEPLREFLHVDDLANAVVFLMEKETDLPSSSLFNVGSGSELSVRELASRIADVVQYYGELVFDHTKPDGTPRKLLDSGLLRSMGWKPEIDLGTGLEKTYEDFLNGRGRNITDE